MTRFLDITPTRRLAFHATEGIGPTVVFLGGFKSDMNGSKALALEAWAAARGRAFLRFDYSGHGQSSGAFLEGSIGDWCADSAALIMSQTRGKIVLVGSSMGGWISLLLAREFPARIAGLVGIAAAPDFTDAIWDAMTEQQRRQLLQHGYVEHPSEYGPEPYVYTRLLIEDGRQRRIFDRPLNLPYPTRWLQGTADDAVPVTTAMRLFEHASGPDIRLTLVKDADHRFSTPECLALMRANVEDVLQAAAQP